MNDMENQFRQALELHRQGRHDDAVAMYRAILDDDPVHTRAALNLASLSLDKGAFDEAKKLCEDVLASGEESPAAELMLSRIAFVGNDHTTGFEHVRNAFRLAPEDEGIAYEYAAAAGRRYWTYRPAEYAELFETAQKGELAADKLMRLCHLAFAKIVRPQMIELLTARPKEGEEQTDVITQWKRELDEQTAANLSLLVANFQTALTAMHKLGLCVPRAAALTLRDGTAVPAKSFTDADPLTHGALEFIDADGEMAFVPFAEIESVEFGAPTVNTPVTLTYSSGTKMRGLVPLFYMFTEFSPDVAVRDGRITLMRELTPDVRLPVGLRAWRTEAVVVPMVNVARIEFK